MQVWGENASDFKVNVLPIFLLWKERKNRVALWIAWRILLYLYHFCVTEVSFRTQFFSHWNEGELLCFVLVWSGYGIHFSATVRNNRIREPARQKPSGNQSVQILHQTNWAWRSGKVLWKTVRDQSGVLRGENVLQWYLDTRLLLNILKTQTPTSLNNMECLTHY